MCTHGGHNDEQDLERAVLDAAELLHLLARQVAETRVSADDGVERDVRDRHGCARSGRVDSASVAPATGHRRRPIHGQPAGSLKRPRPLEGNRPRDLSLELGEEVLDAGPQDLVRHREAAKARVLARRRPTVDGPQGRRSWRHARHTGGTPHRTRHLGTARVG
jgi:hypothetical protein